jgi:hypothetical protein
VSEATSGNFFSRRRNRPGCRFAHPGYTVHA